MEIIKGLEAVDLALYMKKEDALVIADLHIGYEDQMRQAGVLIPVRQLKEMINRFDSMLKLLKKKKVKRIIINGDLKHEFGKINRQEWSETIKFLEFLEEKCDEIIIIGGNHDNVLEPVVRKKEINIVDYLILDDVLIMHGDYVPRHFPKGIKTIVIGHEHPAVSFKDKPYERFKCFLLGKWERRNLIVMPSFFLLTEGTDLAKEQTISPFLSNLKNFEVFVVGDKIRKFGKMKDLAKL